MIKEILNRLNSMNLNRINLKKSFMEVFSIYLKTFNIDTELLEDELIQVYDSDNDDLYLVKTEGINSLKIVDIKII